jgi:hypothetical protein
MDCLWEVADTFGGGPSWGSRSLGVCPWWTLSSSWLYEVNSYVTMDSNSETMGQDKLFFISCWSQVFYYRDRKLTTISILCSLQSHQNELSRIRAHESLLFNDYRWGVNQILWKGASTGLTMGQTMAAIPWDWGASSGWAWWYTPVIPVPGNQRQEDHEFKSSLGYTVSSKAAWIP